MSIVKLVTLQLSRVTSAINCDHDDRSNHHHRWRHHHHHRWLIIVVSLDWSTYASSADCRDGLEPRARRRIGGIAATIAIVQEVRQVAAVRLSSESERSYCVSVAGHEGGRKQAGGIYLLAQEQGRAVVALVAWRRAAVGALELYTVRVCVLVDGSVLRSRGEILTAI